jgi:RsiW-degrading membrane proteinase PrsW (M82 family)
MSGKFFSFIIIVLVALPLLSAWAQQCGPQSDGTYILCSPIPGIEPQVGDLGLFLINVYWFSLMIGGIIVFSRIVYGGLRYIFSAGNPSAQTNAKDIVTQAIWGLALLLGAFLILYTIDPRLVDIVTPGGGSYQQFLPNLPPAVNR